MLPGVWGVSIVTNGQFPCLACFFSLKIVFSAKFLVGRKVHSQNHTVDVAVMWYTPQPFGYRGSSKFAC